MNSIFEISLLLNNVWKTLRRNSREHKGFRKYYVLFEEREEKGGF